MSQEDDKLDALWRRASAEDAGRPAAKTRAAILAEAAAAARRREPAANAPRYWMRMVAGVAVVGIGVVLWRQTEVRLPGEAPVAAPVAAPVVQEMVSDAADANAGAASSATMIAQSREEAREKSSASPAPIQEALVPQSAQPQRVEAAARQEMKVAQERESAADALDRNARAQGAPALMPAAPPPASMATGAAELLRGHFPAQYASAQAHRLWVVLDESGNVLLSGELAPDQRLEDLKSRVREATGRQPGTWRTEVLANEQNRPIEMGIMRLPR